MKALECDYDGDFPPRKMANGENVEQWIIQQKDVSG